jgi:hypothetical protein
VLSMTKQVHEIRQMHDNLPSDLSATESFVKLMTRHTRGGEITKPQSLGRQYGALQPYRLPRSWALKQRIIHNF